MPTHSAGICQDIKAEVAAGTPYKQIACLFRCFKMGGSKVYGPLMVCGQAQGWLVGGMHLLAGGNAARHIFPFHGLCYTQA